MDEIIKLLKEMIKFKSVHSNIDGILECSLYIEKYLKKHSIEYKKVVHNKYPSIVILPVENKSRILLMSHIDVVEGSDDLFTPFEKEGNLFGRGSLDDKYAVALSLVLLKNHLNDLRKNGLNQKDLEFGVIITGDEEIGGFNGADKVLESIESDFCIALDGGGLRKVVTKEKGLIKLKLVSRGKASHGSRPWLGENSIENLFEDFLRIKPFFNKTSSDNWHRTLNLGVISGGESHNQVPDYAEAYLDIRYTENDDVDELINNIKDVVNGEIVIEHMEPLFIGEKSSYLDKLLEISKKSETGFEHGGSDARFLSKYGINGVVWGADGDLSHHTVNEHVSIESIEKLYKVLDVFIKNSRDL